ncbi:unnamed protein product, partial [Mesorhabditis spiculigera]
MSPDVFDIEEDLRRTSTAATRFSNDPSREHAQRLDETLKLLISATNAVQRVGGLRLTTATCLSELLPLCPVLLTNPDVGDGTLKHLAQFLYNLGIHNVSLRRYMSSELELCASLWQALRISLRDQADPDVLMSLIKLFQVLTYENCVVLGPWANDLISFLIQEVIREPEPEWLPFATAILCNLTVRSKNAGARIRKSSNYRPFSKKLLHFLQHDSRLVVVSCLVLVGYLAVKLRDVVYAPANLSMTFKCVFNVLAIGEAPLTRHVACDLLKRMLISETPTVSSQPLPTSTGRELATYSDFAECIQKVSGLLLTLDPLLEESGKILELLTSLCSLQNLRSAVCQAILHWRSSGGELISPISVLSKTACLPVSNSMDAQTPIRALRLLNILLKEAVDMDRHVADYIPALRLVQIVEENVKTDLDTGSPNAGTRCQRIAEGLRLAEVLSRDDEIRATLLGVTSSQLCGHLAQCQFLTNPVSEYMSRPPQARTDPLPEWSEHGTSIVLALFLLLNSLKDSSKPHKEQYWKLLRDARLVPFLAFALTSGHHQQVFNALYVLFHCAQIDEFDRRGLADMVASNVIERQLKWKHAVAASLDTSRENRRSTDSEVLTEKAETSNRVSSVLDDVVNQLGNGLENRTQPSASLVASLEEKIAKLQAQLTSREASLLHAERMQRYATSGESEPLFLRTENEKLTDRNRILEADLSDALAAKEVLVEENRKEMQITAQFRQACREMTDKFERASSLALEKQAKNEELMLDKKILTDDLAESRRQTAERDTEILAKNEKLGSLEVELAANKRKATAANKQLEDCERRLATVNSDAEQRIEGIRKMYENERQLEKKAVDAERAGLEAIIRELREKANAAEAENLKNAVELEKMKSVWKEVMKIGQGL